MVQESKYLIDCRDATVSYPTDDGGRRVIIDRANLKVRKGELITVAGPSGCGKSTLLRLILGSQFPDGGSVLVDDTPVKRVTRDCGIVFQNYALFPHLTVLENVMCGPIAEHTGLFERLALAPINWTLGAQRQFGQTMLGTVQKFLTEKVRYMRVYKEALAKACEFLTTCGIDPVVDGRKYAKELSGGMRQRVAIARAMIMSPKILLMDEPFSGLDHAKCASIQEFVHEQWKSGLTVFVVTHDLEAALKLGTRFICLSQYWCHDDGKPGQGARVMIDCEIEGGDLPPHQMAETSAFRHLSNFVTEKALNEKHRQRVSEFVLTHEDASRPAVTATTGGNS